MLIGADNKKFGSLKENLENKMTLISDNCEKTTGAVVRTLNTYHMVKLAAETFKTKEDIYFVKRVSQRKIQKRNSGTIRLFTIWKIYHWGHECPNLNE